MIKRHLLFSLAFLIASNAISQTNIQTITEKGAWCWFADPRAINYQNAEGTINSTYIGYIDTHGNIKATQIDHVTQSTNEVLIRSYFQPDDHNNPTFLVLPDEHVMVFYSRHTDEACCYYRVSRQKGDITTLGPEMRIATDHNTTYPSPFILSDDPDHIYLCWRGINWHPTIARLTLPDVEEKVAFDWGPYQMVRSRGGQAGTRPYAKYASNGKDKIFLAYTTTHPDNQSVNYIYLNYVDIHSKVLKDVKGQTLATIGSGDLHDIDATQDYKNSHPDAVVDDTPLRNWLWELALDKDENPVIAMVRISDDKKSHDYYCARWTGKQWQKTFLAHAGGHFHQTPRIENCYSAGMTIDKGNPNVIYGSVPVAGKHGRVYELKKFTLSNDGTSVLTEQVTFDSPKNNVRPFIIANATEKGTLTWMYGDYYDWIVSSSRPLGFPTAIKANMEIPPGRIDVKKGLGQQKQIGAVTPEQTATLRAKNSKSFTIMLTMRLDTDAYYGHIVKFAGLIYGLSGDERPKPYLNNGSQTFVSSNVLGSSDVWQTKGRGTGGQWYAPEKLKTFQLSITYADGTLRTFVDGLLDQSINMEGLCLSDVQIGGFKGAVDDARVYSRALSQMEIKHLGDR